MNRSRFVLLAILGLTAAFSAAPARAQESHKYLPSDAEMIASFNFRQVLGSELVASQKEKVEQMKALLDSIIQGNEEAKKYLEALGFDLLRDFHGVTVAGAASMDPDTGLVIVEGKFNPEKFHNTAEQVARENGDILKVIKVGNHKIWEVNAPGHPKTLYMCLANKSTILAALSKSVLTTALEQKEPDLKKEVRELLKTTNSKQSLSFVATGKALSNLAEKIAEKSNDPKGKQVLEMAGPALKMIAGFSAALTVGKNVDFQVGVGTEDKKAADVLSQQATGLIALGRTLVAQKAQQDPNSATALEIMRTLTASVEGTTVILRGQISAAVLEKAMKNSEK